MFPATCFIWRNGSNAMALERNRKSEISWSLPPPAHWRRSTHFWWRGPSRWRPPRRRSGRRTGRCRRWGPGWPAGRTGWSTPSPWSGWSRPCPSCGRWAEIFSLSDKFVYLLFWICRLRPAGWRQCGGQGEKLNVNSWTVKSANSSRCSFARKVHELRSDPLNGSERRERYNTPNPKTD